MSAALSIAEYRAALAAQPARHAASRRAQPEYDAQVRFFVLVDWLAELYPERAGELEDVWATSNGGKRPRGEAGRMRAAGQRKGVLDIECMVPMGPCHGLFIEMKSAVGRPTTEQAARIARLNDRGYLALVARSWQEAGQMLCGYLGMVWPTNAEGNVEWRLTQKRVARKRARRELQCATPPVRRATGRRGKSYRWTQS